MYIEGMLTVLFSGSQGCVTLPSFIRHQEGPCDRLARMFSWAVKEVLLLASTLRTERSNPGIL
jgi:hypothetical protein